jgi:predicted transcriptional regulator
MELPSPQDLRTRRTELDLTQSALADRAGVSQPLIARIEGGDVDPRLSTLRRIVDALEETAGGVVRAEDLMHEAIVSIEPTKSVRDAEALMEAEAYSQLPVIQDGIPIGSISHGDIIEAGDQVADAPVRDVMSESFPPVSPDTPLSQVRNFLAHSKAVIVMDGGAAVGIITEADVAGYLS